MTRVLRFRVTDFNVENTMDVLYQRAMPITSIYYYINLHIYSTYVDTWRHRNKENPARARPIVFVVVSLRQENSVNSKHQMPVVRRRFSSV